MRLNFYVTQSSKQQNSQNPISLKWYQWTRLPSANWRAGIQIIYDLRPRSFCLPLPSNWLIQKPKYLQHLLLSASGSLGDKCNVCIPDILIFCVKLSPLWSTGGGILNKENTPISIFWACPSLANSKGKCKKINVGETRGREPHPSSGHQGSGENWKNICNQRLRGVHGRRRACRL